MAGHSKWANIQHRKGRVDAARGKMWSKLSKAIIIAAQSGGGDPEANFRLRKAVDDAKALSMPKDNIERAIKRGTGEIAGGVVEEIIYEGYGPGGVAIMCEIMTDNRNRTAPELRSMFGKLGGELGKTGCVAYMFDRKGMFVFSAETDEGKVTEVAIENGAEDVDTDSDGKLEVTCTPDAYQDLVTAFESAELKPEISEVTRIAQTSVDVDGGTAKRVLSLLEALDDHDDVQNVSSNLNITDGMIEDA